MHDQLQTSKLQKIDEDSNDLASMYSSQQQNEIIYEESEEPTHSRQVSKMTSPGQTPGHSRHQSHMSGNGTFSNLTKRTDLLTLDPHTRNRLNQQITTMRDSAIETPKKQVELDGMPSNRQSMQLSQKVKEILPEDLVTMGNEKTPPKMSFAERTLMKHMEDSLERKLKRKSIHDSNCSVKVNDSFITLISTTSEHKEKTIVPRQLFYNLDSDKYKNCGSRNVIVPPV